MKRADRIKRWMTAGVLGLLATACWNREVRSSEAGAADPGEYVYVSNEDSRNITVIDARDDSVVTTIEVGTRPRGVKVSPDGRTVYVALSGSPKCPPSMPDEECAKQKVDPAKDGVAVVDVASRRVVRTLPAGSDPEAFDVSPDGSRLFVSNENADSASIIDLAKGTVILNVKTGKEPEGVTVAPDGRIFWVTAETDANITGIDTQSGAVVGVLEVGVRPRAIAFVDGGAKAFVTNEAGGTVTVVDMAVRKVVKTIAMPEGSRPMGLAVAPDGKKIYVSNGRGGTVSVLDASTDAVLTHRQGWHPPVGAGRHAETARSSTPPMVRETMSRCSTPRPWIW